MFLNYSEKSLLKDLIRIQSVTGKENSIFTFLKNLFDRVGWTSFEINMEDQKAGILVTFGVPKILFTTHVDVVDAPEYFFQPFEKDGYIYGRGACDSKGSIASMIFACNELLQSGYDNFGLFLFGGEESGGESVSLIMNYLQGFGIEDIIMGEPTKGRLAKSHLGGLCLNIRVFGSASHSAYASSGIDANKYLLTSANRLYSLDEQTLSLNGIWSINIGRFYGGLSPNTLSPFSAMEVYIRTHNNNHDDVMALIKSLMPEARVEIIFSGLSQNLQIIEGFKTTEAKMCSALPHFSVLGANLYMLGPGDPKYAHSNEECIAEVDLIEAVALYKSLYHEIKHSGSKSKPTDNNAFDMVW